MSDHQTTETERKFTVAMTPEAIRAKYAETYHYRTPISQAYLSDTGDWAIRIRKTIIPARDYPDCHLTMKRKINDETCVELETPIYYTVYDHWLLQCGPELKKTRYHFSYGGRIWYVDEFTQPELGGLLLAEVEYRIEGEHIDLPPWIDQEVTTDPEYRNFKLVNRLSRETA